MFILTVAVFLLFNAYSDSFGHFEAIIADDVTTTLRVEPTSNDEENLAENHEDGCKDEDESDCTTKFSTIISARIIAHSPAILLEFCKLTPSRSQLRSSWRRSCLRIRRVLPQRRRTQDRSRGER